MFDADGHIFESQTKMFEFLEDPFRGKTNLLRSAFFPAFEAYGNTQAFKCMATMR